MPQIERWNNGYAILYPEQLWDEGNMIARWVNSVSNTLSFYVSAAAPVNKRPNRSSDAPATTLKQSVKVTGQNRHLPEGRMFDISMHHYGKYVVHGTAPIVSARKMGLPDNGPMWNARKTKVWEGRQWMHFVNGQSPNDFIEAGWDLAAMAHPAIRETYSRFA